MTSGLIGDHDVAGFNVPVNQTRGVRGTQCVRHLDPIPQNVCHRQAFTGSDLIKRFAVYILHRDEVNCLVCHMHVADFVNRNDVRMIQSRCSAGFPHKALLTLSVRNSFYRQNFDCNCAL
jgi:hypothetical protein